jgi:hypothetical protein
MLSWLQLFHHTPEAIPLELGYPCQRLACGTFCCPHRQSPHNRFLFF